MHNCRAIRLELGPTTGFPQGSPSRAYVLRVPIRPDGFVDAAACKNAPNRATVRRYWANEPDRSGCVEPMGTGWFLRFRDGRWDGTCNMEDVALKLGATVAIAEHGKDALPFRVVSIQPC